jgi:hypothetical protein
MTKKQLLYILGRNYNIRLSGVLLRFFFGTHDGPAVEAYPYLYCSWQNSDKSRPCHVLVL